MDISKVRMCYFEWAFISSRGPTGGKVIDADVVSALLVAGQGLGPDLKILTDVVWGPHVSLL